MLVQTEKVNNSIFPKVINKSSIRFAKNKNIQNDIPALIPKQSKEEIEKMIATVLKTKS